MRKLLVLAAVISLVLTGCNTLKGMGNGFGKDVSALGSGVSKSGDYVQDKIPEPAPSQPVEQQPPPPTTTY